MNKDKASNGFTRFPNEIYDYVLEGEFTATQLKIILTVIRNSYGWNNEYCELSLTDFISVTKCSRSQLIRDIQKLVKEDILIERREGQKRHLKYNLSIINK